VSGTQNSILEKYSQGIKDDEVKALRQKFGECVIEVPMKSIPSMLVDEVLNPFYLF
jgi:carbamoylphosphate synthase large subunit